MLSRYPLVAFVLLAYAWSWAFGLPLLASRRGWWETELPDSLEAIAAFGPLVAALAVTWGTSRADGIRAFLRGLTRWRVGVAWLAVSTLSPLALLGLAALVVRAAGGTWPDPAAIGAGPLATVTGNVELVVVSGLVQGIGEEPGWRGFMLPRLRQRFSPLAATLLLFPAWLLWHLPAFLGRPEFGFPQFAAFALGVLAAAVWLTLIWEKTQSVLMAALWHAVVNIARGVALAISMPMFLALSTLVLAGAALIVGYWLLAPRVREPFGEERRVAPIEKRLSD